METGGGGADRTAVGADRLVDPRGGSSPVQSDGLRGRHAHQQ